MQQPLLTEDQVNARLQAVGDPLRKKRMLTEDEVNSRLGMAATQQSAPPDPQSLASITGDFSPLPTRQPIRHTNQEYDKLKGAIQTIAARDPGAAQRFVESQSKPLGEQLGTGDRYAVDFLSTFAPPTMGLVAKAADYTGLDFGADLSPVTDTSYLEALSAANEPRGLGEGLGRGATKLGGFGLSLGMSPANVTARLSGNIAANAGAHAGLSGASLGAARLSGALAGFTAPDAALDYARGDRTLGQAVSDTALAGPHFMAEAPGMAYRAGEAVIEGDPLRAAGEAAPLMYMALGHRAKKGKPNERQEITAERQGQGRQERLLTQEVAPSTTPTPVAEPARSAPEKASTTIGKVAAKPMGQALPPTDPANRKPWEMTRAEFEMTGEELSHGTSREFDTFKIEGAVDRYGKPVRDKFYFTQKPGVANNMANAGGFRQVDIDRYAEANDLNPRSPSTLSNVRQQLDAAIAKGESLAYRDAATGELKKASKASEIPDADIYDGDVRVYAKGRWPRVVKTKVFGRTLDLTDPKNVPADLAAALKKEGRFDPSVKADWGHEYSKALYDYMREHGYAKAKVRDAYESGFESIAALPEYIALGRDPHRDFVDRAVAEGRSVPESVLKDYPGSAIVKRPLQQSTPSAPKIPVYEGVAEQEGTYETIPPKTGDAPLSFPREPNEKWSSPILKRTGASFYAEPLIDRVERQGGDTGAELGKTAREMAAMASAIEGGTQSYLHKTITRVFGKNLVNTAKGAIPGGEQSKANKARAELSQPAEWENDLGVAKSREILEGNRAPSNSYEAYFRKHGRKVLDSQWAIGKRLGVKTIGRPQGGANDPSRLLDAMRQDRAPRVMLPEFFQLAEQNGPIYQKILEGTAKKNGMTAPAVRELLDEMRSPKAEKSIAMEVARKLKWMPTHVKDGDRVIELMVSDPVDYMNAATRNVADRIAFINKLGQTTQGQSVGDFGNEVQRLRSEFANKQGNVQDFDALMHVANSRSLNILGRTGDKALGGEMASSTSVGNKLGNVVKQTAYAADRVQKSLMLSLASVGNLGEQLGSTMALFKAGDIARGVRGVLPDRYDATVKDMLRSGAINRQPIDLHLRQGRKIADLGKHVGEVIGLPLRGINEAQEVTNGAVAKAMSDRLRESGGDMHDYNLLKTFKFTDAEAKSMVERSADPRLYADLVRRATAKVGGTTLRRTEKSKFGNSPWLQKLFSFQNYSTTQAYLLDRTLGRIAEANRSGKPGETVAAVRQAANFLAGKVASGRTTKLLLAAVAGYSLTRSDEGPLEKLGNDLLTAFGGAPQQVAADTLTSDKPMAEIAARMSPLAGSTLNLIDAIRETGRFEGKDFLTEGLPAYLKSITSASKIQRGFAVMAGLSDAEMNSAISRYYSWPDRPKYTGGLPPDPNEKEMRKHLNAASELVRNGRFEEASGEMEVAYKLFKKPLPTDAKPRDIRDDEGKQRQAFRAKITGKKIVDGMSQEAVDSLRKHVGEEYFKVLQAHDQMLDQFVWQSTTASRFYAEKSELNRKRNSTGLSRQEAKALKELNEGNAKVKKYRMRMDTRSMTPDQRKSNQERIEREFEKALKKKDLRISQEK